MAVKVFITRVFKPDKMGEVQRLLMETRSLATLQKGYVFGETLISADNPNKVLVISTWINPKNWQDWKEHEKRKALSSRIAELLAAPEQVELYYAGERLREWVDMA